MIHCTTRLLRLLPFLVLGLLLAASLATGGCATIRTEKDPLSAQEHLQLGQTYESQGKLQAAAIQYEKAAIPAVNTTGDAFTSSLPVAWFHLGNVRFLQGEHSAAREAYEQAEETMNPQAPMYATMLNNYAWLLYTMQTDLDTAKALAKRAIGAASTPELAAEAQHTLHAIQAAQNP